MESMNGDGEINLGGRPTLYKLEYCDRLIEHMGKGLSFEAFAGLIGVSKQTLYDWEKTHAEFLDAKHRATEACRYWWEKQGVDGLFTETTRDGRESTTRSINARIWEINMKNRFKWKDRIEHSGEIDTSGTKDKIKSLLNDPETAAAARKIALAMSIDVEPV